MPLTSSQLLMQVFPDLPPDEQVAIATVSRMKSYPVGHALCNEGEIEHVFYIIAEGEVEITQKMERGEVRVLGRRKSGDFFGEVALIENKPRSATVTTTTPGRMLEIDRENFNGLLHTYPVVALSMIRRLAAALRATDSAAILDLSRKNAELRLAYEELKAAQAEIVAKEKLEHELEIAAGVQQSLLPRSFPAVPGYDFAAGNSPARQVGGDLYDVRRVDEEHVGLLLADVSDKGVHAALFMALTRALFLSEGRRNLSPSEVALAVHHSLLEVSTKDDMFVTVFYGVLHLASGHMRYIRAGQDLPLLVRADGSPLESLDAKGRFLGMIDVLALEEQETVLYPGDTVVAYSDGVIDAVNPAGDNYTLERLRDLVSRHRAQPPRAVFDTIFADVAAFRGLADAFDDVTVLVASRLPKK